MPTRFVRRAPQQFRGEHVVAVRENIGADRDALAHQSFHRKRPVRYRGLDGFDGNSRCASAGRIKIVRTAMSDRCGR